MNIIEQFRKGEITEQELRTHMEQNPEIREAAEAALSGEMSDEELDGVAAAGVNVVESDAVWI